MFDHEKLDAYRLAIEFVAWVDSLIDELPRQGRPGAVKHLDDASTSIALNIAEGNGKRSVADRIRFLEIARGSTKLIQRLLEQPSTSTSTSTTRALK